MARPAADPNGLVVRLRKLAPLAKDVDKAKQKLVALPDDGKLRAEFAEAQRRATGQANDDNLERLEAATRALRSGSKPRERAVAAHADALHRFRLELGRLASDTKEN